MSKTFVTIAAPTAPVRPASLASRTNAVNAYLRTLTYEEHIPLASIFATLKAHGMLAVMEDGTEWEGFLLGREGRVNFEVRTGAANRWLSLSWYKMASGRYEIVAYLS